LRTTFYRRLWRFNAFVIAAVGILGVIALLAFVALLATEVIFRQRYADQEMGSFPVLAQDGTIEEAPVFNGEQRLSGTPLLALKVGSPPQRGSGGIGSSSRANGEADRNILLINLRDGSSRHILPDNGRVVAQWHVLSATDGPARAYVALVADTRPASPPKYDILIGNFATGKQSWVAHGISALDAPELVDDKAIGFLRSQGGAFIYERYDLANLTKEISRPVALLKAAGTR